MDLMNTVHIFHTLAATPNYIPLLFFAVELTMDFGVDVHIALLPGSENTINDALSYLLFNLTLRLQPGQQISMFQLPRETLGALRE
jgi:hypothetical protein